MVEGAWRSGDGRSGADERKSLSLAVPWVRSLVRQVPFALPLLAVAGALGEPAWTLCAMVLAWFVRRWRLLICTVLCALAAYAHSALLERQGEALQTALQQGGAVSLEGTVARELGNGFILAVDGGTRVALRGAPSFAVGSRVRAIGLRRQSEPPPVKGMFDAEAWMRGLGLAADLDAQEVVFLGHSYSFASLMGLAATAREGLARRLMPPGTESDARRQVLCALALGEKSAADEETMGVFRRGGCLHAFAVSGLHVGIVAGILAWALYSMRLDPSLIRLLIAALAGAYVLLTGMAVPALRAYLMLVLLLGGIHFRRRAQALNLLCFAALLILLLWPWQWHNAGFRLSFAVYGAICLVARFGMSPGRWFAPDEYLPRRLYNKFDRMRSKADYALRGLVLVSLAAWLASLPITYREFHSFNLNGILTNICIAPVLPAAMGLGLATIILGWVPFVGPAIEWLALQVGGALLAVVSFCGGWNNACLPAAAPQPAGACMVLSTGYGNSVCVLGNPGLLLDSGNRETAIYRTEPALFHAGFSPAAFLSTRPTAAGQGGLGLLQGSWPEMRILTVAAGRENMRFRTSAGEYTVYAPPADIPRKPAANLAPVVLWKSGSGSVLYVGDASMLTYEACIRKGVRADTVILGSNPACPVDAGIAMEESGASRLVLLPSYAQGKALPGLRESKATRVSESRPMLLLPPRLTREPNP